MIRPDDNILDFVDDYVHGLLSPQDEQLVEQYCERVDGKTTSGGPDGTARLSALEGVLSHYIGKGCRAS